MFCVHEKPGVEAYDFSRHAEYNHSKRACEIVKKIVAMPEIQHKFESLVWGDDTDVPHRKGFMDDFQRMPPFLWFIVIEDLFLWQVLHRLLLYLV